jgi:hypothetical protein
LRPLALFSAVKLTEIFFHVRPKALKRLLSGKDQRYLKIMRASMGVGLKVVLAEIFEFLFQTRFSPQGSMKALPGSVVEPQVFENPELELSGRALQTDQTLGTPHLDHPAAVFDHE